MIAQFWPTKANTRSWTGIQFLPILRRQQQALTVFGLVAVAFGVGAAIYNMGLMLAPAAGFTLLALVSYRNQRALYAILPILKVLHRDVETSALPDCSEFRSLRVNVLQVQACQGKPPENLWRLMEHRLHCSTCNRFFPKRER